MSLVAASPRYPQLVQKRERSWIWRFGMIWQVRRKGVQVDVIGADGRATHIGCFEVPWKVCLQTSHWIDWAACNLVSEETEERYPNDAALCPGLPDVSKLLHPAAAARARMREWAVASKDRDSPSDSGDARTWSTHRVRFELGRRTLVGPVLLGHLALVLCFCALRGVSSKIPKKGKAQWRPG